MLSIQPVVFASLFCQFISLVEFCFVMCLLECLDMSPELIQGCAYIIEGPHSLNLVCLPCQPTKHSCFILKEVQYPFNQQSHFAEFMAGNPHEIIFQFHLFIPPYGGGGHHPTLPSIRFTAFSALPEALTISLLSSLRTFNQFWI